MEIALIIIGVLLTLVGLVGNILPIVPGLLLNYIAFLLIYFIKPTDSTYVTLLVIFGIISILATLADYFVPLLTAKKYGASKYGMIGAIVGLVVGTFTFNPLGIILGVIIGAIVGELFHKNDFKKALNSGIGTLIGSFLVFILKFVISLILTGLFITYLFI